MHRILFDTNAGTNEVGYILWFDKSLKDIDAIGAELREGLHVILYDMIELETEAVLKFDKELGFWRGLPVPGTMKHINEST